MRRMRRKSRPQTPLQAAAYAVTEVVVVLAAALALSLLIKTFLVQAFFIPSGSMEDTLMVGDRVLVSKLTPGPFSLHHGDPIVFKDPGGWLDPRPVTDQGPLRNGLTTALTFVGLLPQDSGEHLIKRVIGLPGDTVTCCDAKGRLQVNGVPIDETYVRAGDRPSRDTFAVTVQKDHLWVMGDNRSDSCDSRYHPDSNGGQVPISNVVGKAFVVVWPFARFGGVADPPQVFSSVPAATSAERSPSTAGLQDATKPVDRQASTAATSGCG
jgi:signal peptidase I